MPRSSIGLVKQQRQKVLAEAWNDDNDCDDDELFRPSLLLQSSSRGRGCDRNTGNKNNRAERVVEESNNPVASPERGGPIAKVSQPEDEKEEKEEVDDDSKKSNNDDDGNKEKRKNNDTAEEPAGNDTNDAIIMERAQRDAQSYLDGYLNLIQDIPHASSLRWYRKKSSSNSIKATHYYCPCYVPKNQKDLEAGLVTLKRTRENERIVQYIGCRAPNSWIYDKVFDKNLESFYTATENDNENENGVLSSSPVLYDQEKMKDYLKHLKGSSAFREKKESSELLLKTEEIFLGLILDYLKQRDIEREQRRLAKKAVEEEEENQEEENGAAAAAEEVNTMAESMIEEIETRKAPPPENVATAEDKSQAGYLRAGDWIQYHPLQEVASSENCRSAMIVKVNPKKQDIVLELNNGDCLPKDTQVRLIKRLWRGKLKDHPDGKFTEIQHYTFHFGRKGKNNLENNNNNNNSMADKVHKLWQSVGEGIDAIVKNACQSGDSVPDTRPRKEKDTETITSSSSSTKPGVKRKMEKDTETITSSSTAAKRGVKRKMEKDSKGTETVTSSSTAAKRGVKRKMDENNNQQPSHNEPKAEPEPKPKPSWQKDLEQLLEKVKASEQRRRCNQELISAQKVNIETAIALRSEMEQHLALLPKTEDRKEAEAEWISQVAEQLDVDDVRLLTYLSGNVNNLLKISVVNDMNEKCRQYLKQQQQP